VGPLPFAVTLLAHGERYNDIPLWKLETKKSPSDALKNGWLRGNKLDYELGGK
jgi:hypothetical protein